MEQYFKILLLLIANSIISNIFILFIIWKIKKAGIDNVNAVGNQIKSNLETARIIMGKGGNNESNN